MIALLFIAGWLVGAGTIVGIHVVTRKADQRPIGARQLLKQRADLRAMRGK
jgi:hypothetical protein